MATLTIGMHIRQARKRYGMTQAELARRIGTSPQRLYLVETGRTPDPHWSLVARSAQVLHVNLALWGDIPAWEGGADARP